MNCKNCDQPIKQFRSEVLGLSWCHDDGFYGCYKGRPRVKSTYAEPKAEQAVAEMEAICQSLR